MLETTEMTTDLQGGQLPEQLRGAINQHYLGGSNAFGKEKLLSTAFLF